MKVAQERLRDFFLFFFFKLICEKICISQILKKLLKLTALLNNHRWGLNKNDQYLIAYLKYKIMIQQHRGFVTRAVSLRSEGLHSLFCLSS